MSIGALTLTEAERIMSLSALDRVHLFGLLQCDLVKDKAYQLLPLGEEAASYLRFKRKRLTDSSYRDYESCLDKFARHFPHLELKDFEPPVGTDRLEAFMDYQWGAKEPRTYNKNLSIISDFFEQAIRRGKLHGDPTLVIERARKRDVYREVFTPDQRAAILAENTSLRDRIALRLLLDYGIRKGSLQAVRFQHFDHVRKRLTIFAKGGKVRPIPIPDPAFWHDLERHILDIEAEGWWVLMPATRGNQYRRRPVRDKPMSGHATHDWWYGCLANAGIVPEGTTSGEKMHKARHSAGQRLLDHTGNLKAVQQLLGHSSITTTADVYVGWDEAALAASLESVLERERKERS